MWSVLCTNKVSNNSLAIVFIIFDVNKFNTIPNHYFQDAVFTYLRFEENKILRWTDFLYRVIYR